MKNWPIRSSVKNISLRSLLAEQQALERFICVEFNSTPSLATLLSEWYPFNFINPLPDERALEIKCSKLICIMKRCILLILIVIKRKWVPKSYSEVPLIIEKISIGTEAKLVYYRSSQLTASLVQYL